MSKDVKTAVKPQDPDPADIAREEIIINGMPFSKEKVMKMPGGVDIWADGLALKESLAVREFVRSQITKNVADLPSLAGSTADGAQLALTGMLIDIVALASAKDFADYKKTKLKMLGDMAGNDLATGKPIEIVSLAGEVLGKIQRREVMLTAVLKGVPAVLTEIMTRSTQVVGIIAGASRKK